MSAVFVYMTCSSREEAEKIASAVVEKRLAACANIMAPHKSVYWWEGKIAQGQETAVILKTRAELFDKLKDEILKLHSYECPCVVALPIEKGHEPFLRWVEVETKV